MPLAGSCAIGADSQSRQRIRRRITDLSPLKSADSTTKLDIPTSLGLNWQRMAASLTQSTAGRREHPSLPPLENGAHLSAREFLRRYEAPEVKKAELINGIVYMGSPVRLDQHGEP